MHLRALIILLTVAVCLGEPARLRAQAPTGAEDGPAPQDGPARGDGPTLTIEKTTVQPGGQSGVPVALRPGQDIGSLDLTLQYDPKVARFVKAEAGPAAPGTTPTASSQTPGVLEVTLMVGNGLWDHGPVLLLTFEAVGPAGRRTALTIDADKTRAYRRGTLERATLTLVSGELVVGGAAEPDPSPSQNPTPPDARPAATGPAQPPAPAAAATTAPERTGACPFMAYYCGLDTGGLTGLNLLIAAAVGLAIALAVVLIGRMVRRRRRTASPGQQPARSPAGAAAPPPGRKTAPSKTPPPGAAPKPADPLDRDTALKADDKAPCPRCGTPTIPGSRYCFHCGLGLR